MPKRNVRIVVVVASLGGLDALTRILAELPSAFPAAIAVVQHRGMSLPNLLGEILQPRTKLHVKNAADGEAIQPGVVYIAPPGVHLVVEMSQRFALRDGVKVKHVRPSGDVLFESAAEAFGPEVVGLVLTGGDGDGADGVVAIKRCGGTVISQDEATARDASMPRSAIATGDVDYVLPLAAIGAKLQELVFGGGNSPNPPIAFA